MSELHWEKFKFYQIKEWDFDFRVNNDHYESLSYGKKVVALNAIDEYGDKVRLCWYGSLKDREEEDDWDRPDYIEDHPGYVIGLVRGKWRLYRSKRDYVMKLDNGSTVEFEYCQFIK